ncbi:class I adenylate-forming enzyme family protein [Actinokineospora sp.]|uniref:class I adenylate-forming enzyme family protein n=1 Tax=Actinokineospora sp. TaxID=1872133 RepID=UPI004038452F
MTSANPRLTLAATPGIGAGTYLRAILATGRDLAAPALYLPGAAKGDPLTELSLGELVARVDAVAQGLHARGIGPRDPIALLSRSVLDCATFYLAATRLGAIPALINAKVPVATLRSYLDRLRPVAMVADEDLLAAGAGADLRFTTTLAELADSGIDLPDWYPFAHHDDDPVLITHSSGTTGVPKAVTMTHRSLFAAIHYRLRLPLSTAYRRIVSALPPSHNSAVTLLSMVLTHDVPVLLLSTQDADAVLDAIEAFRPTMVTAFGSTYGELAGCDLDARDLSSVTLWWNSGDAAHHAQIQKLVRHGSREVVTAAGRATERGSTFIDGLGSSEMGHALFHRQHLAGDPARPRCIGKPYLFAEAAALNTRGEVLPAMEVGLLGVRSPTVTPGYWNDSATTFRSRLNGYWLTGDLVYRDAQGSFFHMDRASDAVRTERGVVFTVLAEELVLQEFAEVADCTVVSRVGERSQPEVRVLLELADPDAAFDEDAWRARIDAVLVAHGMSTVDEVRRTVAADVPHGVTGKVRKRAVRENQFGWAAAAVEPMNIVGGHYG